MAEDRKKRGDLGKEKSKPKSKGKKGAKKPHKMVIRKAHDNSYIIEHHHKPSDKEAPEVDEHTAPDMQGLLDHVQNHMAGPEEEQEPEHAMPAPQPGGMMGAGGGGV